ncbi:MAG TPA: methylated-DNA--[protein]-cysteine S-methyltransferase [Ktedonobacteraceae bacterium]|nr:methylated-DNA--[protein]-cysteine S-methyltransferase [Ktedonobacteraceae bacterium]
MLAVRQMARILYWSSVPSPLGECVLMATEAGVCWVGTPGAAIDEGLYRTKHWLQIDRVVKGEEIAPLQLAAEELKRYFAEERIRFSCPLDLQGTPFQLRVWQELCQIPYGETRSYGEIAHVIGCPTAARAVGAANGANPIAIIVPCHRVIGGNGKLTGYGGGLPTKSWLLSLEGVVHKSI